MADADGPAAVVTRRHQSTVGTVQSPPGKMSSQASLEELQLEGGVSEIAAPRRKCKGSVVGESCSRRAECRQRLRDAIAEIINGSFESKRARDHAVGKRWIIIVHSCQRPADASVGPPPAQDTDQNVAGDHNPVVQFDEVVLIVDDDNYENQTVCKVPLNDGPSVLRSRRCCTPAVIFKKGVLFPGKGPVKPMSTGTKN